MRRLIVLAILLASAGCASPSEPDPDVRLLEVAPTRGACLDGVTMTCLQVRSAPTEPFLSASIRGFAWELNNRYMIEAKLLPAVAPEDGDVSAAYQLRRVLLRAPEIPAP